MGLKGINKQENESVKYILYDVLLPLGGVAIFTYKSLSRIEIGSLVKVHILNTYKFGVVICVSTNKEKDMHFHTKEIESIIYTWKFSTVLIEFITWISQYNLIPIGIVLSLYFIPKKLTDSYLYVLCSELNSSSCSSFGKGKSMTEYKKLLYLGSLFQGHEYIPDFILNSSSIRSCKELLRYEEKGYIKRVYETPILNDIFNIRTSIILSEEQKKISQEILLKNNIFQAVFIDGVTGSGKTMLYISIVLDTINNSSKQVLILVPEINLINTIIKKIKSSIYSDSVDNNVDIYGENVVEEWHSNISEKKRNNIWYSISKNYKRIIVGARSALFLPYVNLALIVVDEEHDSSFKQTLSQSSYAYNTRDMAVILAKKMNIPIILTSATPSIETMYNAKIGKYKYYFLMNRWKNVKLPNIKVVDMKKNVNTNKYLSIEVINALDNNLKKKEQSMIFINKRGFAKVMLCINCGYKFVCKFCSTYLVLYKRSNRLLCHCCGYFIGIPTLCDECYDGKSLKLYGVGIEQVTSEVLKIFHNAKVASISSDEVQGNVRKLDDYIDNIRNNRFDIIICTQILAKGHTFPNLSLVCIIDADNNAHYSDLRYAEKSFQILTQVIGRAGRSEGIIGNAIVQTFKPSDSMISALKSNNREVLYTKELDNRKKIDFPPFSRIAIILLKNKEQIKTLNFAIELSLILKKDPNVVVFGPTPSIIEKINSLYRFKILVKSKKNYRLQDSISKAIQTIKKVNKENVKISVDIDPIDLL